MCVLVAVAFVFIMLQVHLFTTQTEYAERLAAAIGAESQCTSHTRLLIDQISMQQEKIVNLEDSNKRCEEESAQLKTLVSDLEKKSLQSLSSKTEDGTNPDVKKAALSYSQITYIQHLDFEPVHAERPGELIAYYKISRHYKWALDELFLKHNFNRVIILEDDMEIAPDFFDYFEATATLLDRMAYQGQHIKELSSSGMNHRRGSFSSVQILSGNLG